MRSYLALSATTAHLPHIVNIAQEIEENVNNKLPQSDPSTYLTGISNAEVMSGKSVGLDYANNIDLFILRRFLGVRANAGRFKMARYFK